jgi:hypothetical protein
MRWLDKPIHHPGPSSPTEKICDRTRVRADAKLARVIGNNHGVRQQALMVDRAP